MQASTKYGPKYFAKSLWFSFREIDYFLYGYSLIYNLSLTLNSLSSLFLFANCFILFLAYNKIYLSDFMVDFHANKLLSNTSNLELPFMYGMCIGGSFPDTVMGTCW